MSTYPLYQRQGMQSYKRIMHRLGEFVYRIVIVPLVAFLPASLAYKVAYLRGNFWYQQDTSTRERIIHNLTTILGEKLTHNERTRVARDYFRRRSCEAMDVMRLARS